MSGFLSDGSGGGLGAGGGLGNFVVGWQNQVLTGPIIASAAVTGLGPDQLQNDQGSPATAWQTPTGTTSAAILLTRPPGSLWRLFGLARTNLTPQAVVTWNVLSGGLSGAPVYVGISDPPAPGYGQAVHVAPADMVGDTMQVNIVDPTNPDGFLNIPLMYAGAAWQPQRNYGYASAVTATDQSTQTTTRSGAEYVRNDWIRRGFDLVLGAVAPEEVLDQLIDLDRFGRRGGNVLFVPRPGGASANKDAVFGRLVPAAPIGWANNSRLTRSWRATITERL